MTVMMRCWSGLRSIFRLTDCLRGDAVTSGIDMTLLMLLMGLIRIVFLQHRLVWGLQVLPPDAGSERRSNWSDLVLTL